MTVQFTLILLHKQLCDHQCFLSPLVSGYFPHLILKKRKSTHLIFQVWAPGTHLFLGGWAPIALFCVVFACKWAPGAHLILQCLGTGAHRFWKWFVSTGDHTCNSRYFLLTNHHFLVNRHCSHFYFLAVGERDYLFTVSTTNNIMKTVQPWGIEKYWNSSTQRIGYYIINMPKYLQIEVCNI